MNKTLISGAYSKGVETEMSSQHWHGTEGSEFGPIQKIGRERIVNVNQKLNAKSEISSTEYYRQELLLPNGSVTKNKSMVTSCWTGCQDWVVNNVDLAHNSNARAIQCFHSLSVSWSCFSFPLGEARVAASIAQELRTLTSPNPFIRIFLSLSSQQVPKRIVCWDVNPSWYRSNPSGFLRQSFRGHEIGIVTRTVWLYSFLSEIEKPLNNSVSHGRHNWVQTCSWH